MSKQEPGLLLPRASFLPRHPLGSLFQELLTRKSNLKPECMSQLFNRSLAVKKASLLLGEGREWDGREFGVGGRKLLHLSCLGNGALLHSTGNCVWLGHFAAQQKLRNTVNLHCKKKEKSDCPLCGSDSLLTTCSFTVCSRLYFLIPWY